MQAAAAYTPFLLRIYNWLVLSFSNNNVWRCPTTTVLLPHFQRYLTCNHADIGVGTGYYLQQSVPWPNQHRLVLIDLNETCLETATNAVKRANPLSSVDCVKHDVFQPYPPSLHKFDSMSMFYLLHCLPGNGFESKECVIANAANILNSDGCLYGSTILADPSMKHNLIGRLLLAIYNHRGIFGNYGDSAVGLKQILMKHFEVVEIKIHGQVALFLARNPQRHKT